jgi:hypothetical protein
LRCVATVSCQGAHYAARRRGCAGLPCWAPFHSARRAPGPAAPGRDRPVLSLPSLSRAAFGVRSPDAARPSPPASLPALASRWQAAIEVQALPASATLPASEEPSEVSSPGSALNQPFVLPCLLRHPTHRIDRNAHVSRRDGPEPPRVVRTILRTVMQMVARMKPPTTPLLDSTHGTTGGTCYASTTPPQSFTWWRARHEGTGHHE